MEKENDASWLMALIKMLTCTVMESDRDLAKANDRIKELERENAALKERVAYLSPKPPFNDWEGK
jgi:hypothetical protein